MIEDEKTPLQRPWDRQQNDGRAPSRRALQPLPRYIGVYRVERRLAQGGMGEIFLAHDDRLDRKVAIKQIRNDASSETEYRVRLRREAQAAARLNHPAIAQVYDVVSEEAGDSIVMEYIEGHTLAHLMRRGRVDGALAVHVAIQVAQGLTFAHEQGLVHRDLKADNVMVSGGELAKILDFGLVKRLTDEQTSGLTEHGTLVGTVSAMSPEQASGLEIDARSDLFSFGILLYETFTGRSPFRRDDWMETLEAIKTHHPPSPGELRPELPPELVSLIERLLEKDPNLRFESAREATEELKRIAARTRIKHLPALSATAADDADARHSSPWVTPTLGRDASAKGSAEPPRLKTSRWSDPAPGAPAPGAPAATRPHRWWRLDPLLTVVAVVALAALGIALYLLSQSAAPLHVLVLEPTITGSGGPELELLRRNVVTAALGRLSRFENLRPIDPAEIRGAPKATPAQARFVAADELLKPEIVCGGGSCQLTFLRLRRLDAAVIGATDRIEIPSRPEASGQLIRAVDLHLRRLYGHRRPPEKALLEIADEDYATYSRLQRRAAEGAPLGQSDLAELQAVLKRSPSFFDGHVLAAGMARSIGSMETARAHLERARRLHPDQPRMLAESFNLELEAGRLDVAGEVLETLEESAPGSTEAERSRARLLVSSGDLQAAVRVARDLAERRPTWRNLWELADIELRAVEITATRRTLERLLELSPDNAAALEKRAEVEYLYGDPARADAIYTRLIEERPQRMLYSNQATARFLDQRYQSALESYRRALELDPNHLVTRFNLALAESAVGEKVSARSRLSEIVDELAQRPDKDTDTRWIELEARARLGEEPGPILHATEQLRDRRPGDPFANYSAALIAVLLDQQEIGWLRAERARHLGLSSAWFEVPEFAVLASSDPERYAALISAAADR